MKNFRNYLENDDQKHLEKFLNDSRIIKKDLGSGIVSLNFSRDVFFKKDWNDLTIKARGLFYDTQSKKIIARSYNKFFNINEQEPFDQTLKRFKYPVKVWHKYNGFLGILGYHESTDSLFAASKSTNAGDFASWFKTHLMSKLTRNEYSLKSFLKKNDVSLVFEVIDTKNDPHLIHYKKDDVILLDIIKNQTNFSSANFSTLQRVAKSFGFKCKELVKTLNNESDVLEFYKNISQDDYEHNGEKLEGFVFEDKNKFMIKFKTGYYSYWKKLRGAVDSLVKLKLKFSILDDLVNLKLNDLTKEKEILKDKFNKLQEKRNREKSYTPTKEEIKILSNYKKLEDYARELNSIALTRFKNDKFLDFVLVKKVEELKEKSIIDLREEYEKNR